MKLYHSHFSSSFILFLFLSIFTIQYLNVTAATCHVDDETGLLGFKSGITADPSGILSSWKKGTDCCTWAGVTCLNNHRVTSFRSFGLSGQIPANIGNLTQLEAFSLEGNQFTGNIPSSLSELTGLTQLKLGGNFLTREVPDGIRRLKNLTLLSLDRNRLSGTIPGFLLVLHKSPNSGTFSQQIFRENPDIDFNTGSETSLP
ncbi:leucine-rich repeat receptor-like protein kinase PXC2 [Quillaja saponaria]|uniref:Leucine-rich repeat receptor-like protein kinase PXC2 n=1 Tax=Quillaja saponaria TaxID=32244 RepID=A0AAD7L3I9_QUISA|nr:leucine-rich repeat receptor-like protein kinase PXC2 [Quillaja saponaria]